MSNVEKPWGGRFSEPTNKLVEAFTASLPYDRRLYAHDIEGSMAHCRMLSRVGVISKQEEKRILGGLKKFGKILKKVGSIFLSTLKTFIWRLSVP
jgi:argininosuccinate lyase